MAEMPKPKKGGKPKQITTKNKPGHTGPGGANPAGGKSILALAEQSTNENRDGTKRSK